MYELARSKIGYGGSLRAIRRRRFSWRIASVAVARRNDARKHGSGSAMHLGTLSGGHGRRSSAGCLSSLRGTRNGRFLKRRPLIPRKADSRNRELFILKKDSILPPKTRYNFEEWCKIDEVWKVGTSFMDARYCVPPRLGEVACTRIRFWVGFRNAG